MNALNKIYEFLNDFIHPNELKIRISDTNTERNRKSKKECPVTGLDISMQPRNSKFLSYTGVKWYYHHDYKTYSKVLAPRLSSIWKNRDINDQCKEIAHSIRNSDSNPRNNTRRAIRKVLSDNNSLFNNLDLIDKTKLKEAGLA